MALENVLENYQQYFAHTHPVKKKEKLHEHTQKVLEYFLVLIDKHGTDRVADSLISEIVNSISSIEHPDIFGNYLKRLFVDSIAFHDFGKINENFQVEKMKASFKPNPDNGIGSTHSKLSAYLFLNFHAKNIFEQQDLNIQEKTLLYAFSYLFANPILRHHSSFIDHYIDFEEDIVRRLKTYLASFAIDIDENLQSNFFNNREGIFEIFDDKLKDTNCFVIYALLKLNFSVLTSADFYATFAFRNDVEIEDFGLIYGKLRNEFSEKFRKLKPYNKKLFENFNEYLLLPFDKIQERKAKNLNLLRQKLAAEVLNNIRKYSSQHLFYLEAPTGSGKTNLSLAGAIELLKLYGNINKIFYVFPFTTLVSQTFKSIRETIGATNDQLIQLHSKSGFHSQNEDGNNDEEREEEQNYIDNLFLNYPITLLTHIKFFDILKGNGKETNYLLHRLSNSIVIIDELQTYDPKHWDKVIFFLSQYAKHFNIRFVLMSATLPKIDELNEETKGKIVSLVDNKNKYFQNPNFSERVHFDFSLLEKGKEWSKGEYLHQLSNFILQKSENYASTNDGKVRILIECIIKKTASKLYRNMMKDDDFASYKKYLISGEILEPRRAEIIKAIDEEKDEKVIVVSTQVVEAGVNIDMDLGFKDRSLIDSDEQLAGRINRNAGKDNCTVFLFNYDRTDYVYRDDKRYKITTKEITDKEYQEILFEKDFDRLYKKVSKSITERNKNPLIEGLSDYKRNFRLLDFSQIKNKFKLIEDSSNSVYVPLDIPSYHFDKQEKDFISRFNVPIDKKEINGGDIFEIYQSIVTDDQGTFINKKIDIKKIYGLMAKFMFSVFKTQEQVFAPYLNPDLTEKFGILYLQHWNKIYDYEDGLNVEEIKGAVFI
ncbi:MAG: CRISPR-associated helicase Cas3' [Balneolaceae bacterium]